MKEFVQWIEEHVWNVFSGLICGLFAYFMPIRNIVILMLAFIVFDLITGIVAARKRGEAITSEKMWNTVNKTLISVALVVLLYAVDKEFNIINVVCTHKIMGLFVVGFELWSILENAVEITNHSIFRALKKFMHDKVEEKTGVDLDTKNEEETGK
jgi:phage-related holin